MRRLHFTPFVFAIGLLFSGATGARAQDTERKWEVGGQFSAFSVSNGEGTVSTVFPCFNPPCPVITTNVGERRTEPGFGARVGYSFNRYLTAEAEFNFFPREGELTDSDFTGGRKVQGLFGVKVGRRFERVGVFAKARPGFVNFREGDLRPRPGIACIAIFPPPLSCSETTDRTDFAFDVGGVFELYPSAQIIVRLDAGDTILRSGAHTVPGTILSRDITIGVPADTSHNFQGSVGFGFRF
jgi:hypothetical protein